MRTSTNPTDPEVNDHVCKFLVALMFVRLELLTSRK